MFCKNCGNECVAQAVVCVKCGCSTGNVTEATGKELTKGEKLVGWLGAIFMPIIGIIMGIVALTRGKIGEGIGMIALSIFMCFFWIGFMEGLGGG